jgi:glycosyltransferase involved in cell wall biosynthesis
MFKQQSKSKYVNIYINDCIRWSGGVNILTQIVNSLIDYDINFKILYVKESLLMKLLNRLRLTLRGGGYKNNKIIDEDLLNKFKDYVEINNLKLQVLEYKHFKQNYENEYIFPVMKINSSLKNKKIIGYIPDCQHLHLKSIFLKRIIYYRNFQIKRIREYSLKVYSTSENVKNDLVEHYNFLPEKINVTGFIPMRIESILPKFEKFEEDFFLIANQLWKHKNHTFAIKAFKEYIDKNQDVNTLLYCTGYIHDHRDSTHSSSVFNLIETLNLTSRVKFLGYLDREEFVKYLINCKALIQPTLFEGSPGGFSVADAVAYGVPVLLSDIPINREVDKGDIEYFDLSKPSSLVELLNKDFNFSLENRYKKSQNISMQAIKNMQNIISELTS